MTMYEILELIKIAGWTTIAGWLYLEKRKYQQIHFGYP